MIEKIIKDLGPAFLKLDKNFSFGSHGELLRRHLEKLWFENCVTMPPYNVSFLSSSDRISQTLTTIKASGATDRPMGIAVIEDSKNPWNLDLLNNIKPSLHKSAKVTIITDSTEAKTLYHKKQRERKVWWRKLSREPSKFAATETKKIKNNIDTVEIKANFSFGSILLETITHQQEPKKFFSHAEAPYSDAQIIEHEASLDWGCLAYLCDAFSSTDENNFLLKLHPKLAPYKVGICIESLDNDDSKLIDKLQLLHYLNNKLKLESIETITTKNYESLKYFHTPIVIRVDDSSLENGIVKVWSQSTTLDEHVHLTDLTKHVISRCN